MIARTALGKHEANACKEASMQASKWALMHGAALLPPVELWPPRQPLKTGRAPAVVQRAGPSLHVLDRLAQAPEVLVVHCKLSRDSLVREILEHLREQVNSGGVEVGHYMTPWLLLVPREVGLPVRQLGNRGPVLLRWRSEDLEDLEQLIVISVAGEEGPAVDHFCKDAANAPDVHGSGVFSRAHEHIGRTVPQSDHLVGVTPHRNAEGTCQAKVGQLESSLPVDQEVLRLQIAVEHAVLVAVRYAPQQLVEE
mmetsp:Transcript_102923/g.320739  ORF Transcript_102923/g.320739 Transcript_102923/m.320739 type:complete len:253 (-) Transcript_102923:374-1132(-)